MFGCGGDRDPTKRKEMGKIAHEYSNIGRDFHILPQPDSL